MHSMKKQLLINSLVVIFIFISSPVIQAAGRTSINLRSSYAELSVSQVHQLPHKAIRKEKRWGFYGHSTISHIYEENVINGDKVVIDNGTDLTWHQSGSDKYMSWTKAKKWVKTLNEKRYAGYNDWRLPTVEEALSLLESRKNKDGLYIDSVFDKKQDWIWTGDGYISGGHKSVGYECVDAWEIGFRKGRIGWSYILTSRFVRPLRSDIIQILEDDKVSSAILQKEQLGLIAEETEEPPVAIRKQQKTNQNIFDSTKPRKPKGVTPAQINLVR